jgi:uncharacterized protein (TIGR00369 family)
VVDEPVLRLVRSAPDDLFRIYGFHIDGQVVRASMPLGDWSAEADGLLAPGSLGVLVDDVLAYASLTTAPDRWSVTTEMTLDVYPALQRAGDRLHAEAKVVQADVLSGFAVGQVRSACGEIVASCTQRTRFLDGRPQAAARSGSRAAGQLRRMHPASLVAGERTACDASVRLKVVPELQNPLNNLHGGISMYACDLAVARALALEGAQLVTTSVQVAYLRPVAACAHIEFRPTMVHRGRTLAVVDVAGLVDGSRNAIVARASAQPLI